MTTEEIKRRSELYSALAAGKTIQVKNTDGEWADVKLEELNYIPEELVFRVKHEPKYRPFKTKEECWAEMHNHADFGWVLRSGVYLHILSLYKDALYIQEENDAIYFDNAFNELTFTDGTPFGVKEE